MPFPPGPGRERRWSEREDVSHGIKPPPTKERGKEAEEGGKVQGPPPEGGREARGDRETAAGRTNPRKGERPNPKRANPEHYSPVSRSVNSCAGGEEESEGHPSPAEGGRKARQPTCDASDQVRELASEAREGEADARSARQLPNKVAHVRSTGCVRRTRGGGQRAMREAAT